MSIEGTDAPGLVIRERVIEKAREVSGKALARLRGLAGELPEGTVEQVERLHRDPSAERRKAARLGDVPLPALIRTVGPLSQKTEGVVWDHSPTGLLVLLAHPLGVGTVLHLRLPQEMGGGWVAVEVRHCRSAADGWLIGCELVPGQTPL